MPNRCPSSCRSVSWITRRRCCRSTATRVIGRRYSVISEAPLYRANTPSVRGWPGLSSSIDIATLWEAIAVWIQPGRASSSLSANAANASSDDVTAGSCSSISQGYSGDGRRLQGCGGGAEWVDRPRLGDRGYLGGRAAEAHGIPDRRRYA